MRSLGGFLAAIAGTLVLAAALAWPAWLLVQALGADWPFPRVVNRLWQLLLLAALFVLVRRLELRDREAWGYGLRRRAFLRQAATGLAIGIATMLPMSIAMLALGIRTLEPDLGWPVLAEAAGKAALAGLGVAILEETFFRGLMFRAIARESGLALAAWSTALLYSAVHFLASASVPRENIAWEGGFRLLAGALGNYADPARIADSFITLVLVGLLLALVRARTGAIAAGIGLHMGWVAVIKTTTAVTDPASGSRWSMLVGPFDGYTGWLVAGWALLLVALAWIARRSLVPASRESR